MVDTPGDIGYCRECERLRSLLYETQVDAIAARDELAARRDIDAEARRLGAAIVPQENEIAAFGLLPIKPLTSAADYPSLASALKGIR